MADPAARLRDARDRLIADGPPPGRAWCHAWSAEVDAALAELTEGITVPGRIAVVAGGGYGRSELCPGSDIDLVVLHSGLGRDALEQVVRQLAYPLWDAGLTVGHAVRDVKQAVATALEDLDTGTSTLDARLVAGDRDLLRTVVTELVAKLRKKPARFLTELSRADDDRHHRAGDAAEALEPDLKDGAGGLRDVQSLTWAAAALLGEVALDPLVATGYVGASDRARLARAYEHILTVRVALHLVTGRKTDVLTLDHQHEVARRLGYADGERPGADAMLHDVFLATRTVDHVHRRAWTLLMADATKGRRMRRVPDRRIDDEITLADGVLRLDEAAAPVRDASLPTRLLYALADTGAVLDRGTAARLTREAEAATDLAWDGPSRQRFLAALWRGAPAINALAELDDVGLLVAVIPEWAPARGRPQRNPYHRFSLDRHAFHAAAELGELVRRERWAAEALQQVEDREGLMLGVLLHDIGKAYGEPHSHTGIAIAEAVMERLGADDESRRRVGVMVRHHLLIPDVATRRDLADEGLAASVAEAVGDHETLACLHLLAAADGIATGPSAWSSWKASLVATLVGKVRAVLDDTHPEDVEGGAHDTARAAQELAPSMGVDERTVREHLAQLSARYAASVAPRAVVRQAAVAAVTIEPNEVRTRVTPGDDEEGRDELDVVARDRPGLFAKVAGVLALHGGSVLSAHAFTRDDGVAVDAFTVARPDGSGGSWWAGVEGDLVEAVAGRLAIRARVAKKAASQRKKASRLPAVETEVRVSSDVSGQTTLVEVHTEDGIGVLYRIAAALAELELDVVSAKVATIGNEVVDVFYVRDADHKPLDTDHAEEVILAVTAALS